MTEATLEQEIQDKGLNAPRLTPEMVENTISYTDYHIVTNTTCTVCTMVLKNGYVVVGQSAAVSMANFDAKIGHKIAREDAREQIWALEGYLLKQRLYELNKG